MSESTLDTVRMMTGVRLASQASICEKDARVFPPLCLAPPLGDAVAWVLLLRDAASPPSRVSPLVLGVAEDGGHRLLLAVHGGVAVDSTAT